MVAYSGNDEKDSEPARRKVRNELTYFSGPRGIVEVRNISGTPFWCDGGALTHGQFHTAPSDGLVAHGGEVFSCVSGDGGVVDGSVSWWADSGGATMTVHLNFPPEGPGQANVELAGDSAGQFAVDTNDLTIELRRGG